MERIEFQRCSIHLSLQCSLAGSVEMNRDTDRKYSDSDNERVMNFVDGISHHRRTQGNTLCNEFERMKLFSHWLLNVTSSVIGPGHNLNQSQPSISNSSSFPSPNFCKHSVYSHTTGGRTSSTCWE